MELEEGTGLQRAMIFNRPPVLADIFKKVGIEMPKGFSGLLGRAAGLFKKNMTPAGPRHAPASTAAALAPSTSSAQRQYEESVRLSKVASRQYPTFEESLNTYPPYVPPTPGPPPNTSLPPWKRGGTRSRTKNSKSKTRKAKPSHTSFGRLFRDVWKQHVQVKHV
jgi:hypothetical protein